MGRGRQKWGLIAPLMAPTHNFLCKQNHTKRVLRSFSRTRKEQFYISREQDMHDFCNESNQVDEKQILSCILIELARIW